MSFPRFPFLSILLYLSILTQTITGAVPPTPNYKPPRFWYSPGTTTPPPPPSGYNNPWHVALATQNRTSPPSPISGQAILGTLSAAMYNISLSSPQSPILGGYYNYTSSSFTPSEKSYIATIGVKITEDFKPPYTFTYSKLLEALSILGGAYAEEGDMGNLVEWGFDVWVLDRLHPDRGRVVAKGAITQPPRPLVMPGGEERREGREDR
ncbi:MAG: hypothetical protein Q9221_001360 [Calogaya cf. arnoldii]